MEIITSRCSGYGHAEFVIRCDACIPRPDIEWLIELLETSVRNGRRYHDGELVQLGWMLNRVTTERGGRLLLQEPDMRSNPIEWGDGVTETLRDIRMQKDTADSLGLGELAAFPTIAESAIVGVDLVQGKEDLLLERTAVSGNDSGWFVGGLESQVDYSDPKNLRRLSLYELAIRCPRAVMFMALPAGVLVKSTSKSLSVWREGQVVGPLPGSFLDGLFNVSNHPGTAGVV